MSNALKVKIVGYGWVGKAMHGLFPNALIHDPVLGHESHEQTDVAFICVPTPLVDGKLDTSIVEDAVRNCEADLIIIRSTVMPGTTDKLIKDVRKMIVFQPEYLGETANHPMTDQKSRPFLILGGAPLAIRKVIELYQGIYNANITIRQMAAYEAEVVKLTENRAIAFKVGQCQELYDACAKAGIDYYKIRDAVYGDDPRFNLWWTFVFPNQRGFNSKCIPKDVYAWEFWAESVGLNPKLTKALLKTNDELLHPKN